MNTNKKTYYISVVCTDATTHTAKIKTKTRAEANQFCNGMSKILTDHGKTIYNETVKPTKEQ